MYILGTKTKETKTLSAGIIHALQALAWEIHRPREGRGIPPGTNHVYTRRMEYVRTYVCTSR